MELGIVGGEMINNKLIYGCKYLLMSLVLIVALSTYAIAEDASVFNVSDGIGSDQFPRTISYDNFNLNSNMVGGSLTDPLTGIIVNKEIRPTNKKNSPNITLTLEMPPKPAKLDVVLAMDTSGSMVQHYADGSNQTYIDWASLALAQIVSKYPEARVSIVSWDDENEADDTSTGFYYMPDEIKSVQEILENLYKECRETDHTVYSIGIKRSIQVLDDKKNWPEDPYNTARIIIFITGLSEFFAEPTNSSSSLALDNQIEHARQNRSYGENASFYGYQIIPIRIGIDANFPWQLQNLSNMLNKTAIPGHPTSITEPIRVEEIDKLDEAISEILVDLKSRPIAYDIKVNDTIYPYLIHLGSDNSFSDSERLPASVNDMRNPLDGSTTLSWSIGSMNGSEKWNANITTQLKLELPIEVSSTRTHVKYGISNATPISQVKYRWMTGYRGNLNLPEGHIYLSSINSQFSGPGIDAEDDSRSTSQRKQQPDPGVLSSLGSLIALTYLIKRR
jgi:hypothetical protein